MCEPVLARRNMAAQPVLFSMRVFGLEARFRGAQNTERLIITQGVTSHQETKMRKRGRKRRRETEREGGREGERWAGSVHHRDCSRGRKCAHALVSCPDLKTSRFSKLSGDEKESGAALVESNDKSATDACEA